MYKLLIADDEKKIREGLALCSLGHSLISKLWTML